MEEKETTLYSKDKGLQGLKLLLKELQVSKSYLLKDNRLFSKEIINESLFLSSQKLLKTLKRDLIKLELKIDFKLVKYLLQLLGDLQDLDLQRL